MKKSKVKNWSNKEGNHPLDESIIACGGFKNMSFGNILNEIRLRNRKTLRQYCVDNGLHPGNVSKLERNILSPPASIDKIFNLLNGLKYNDFELELLITAAQNHHIAKVITRF